MNKRIAGLLFSAVAIVSISSCSSDKKTSDSAAVLVDDTSAGIEATDAPVGTEASVTEPAPTGAVATEAPATATEAAAGGAVTRLADDSPTCNSIRKVKELNDKAGELTVGLSAAMGAGETATDPDAIQKAFDDYITAFAKESETLVPELNGAYDVLAKEQPQFAADLANLKDVTGPLINRIAELKGRNLAEVNLSTFLSEAVPQEKIAAAGASSLKIDTFSKAACDLPFANT